MSSYDLEIEVKAAKNLISYLQGQNIPPAPIQLKLPASYYVNIIDMAV